MSRSVAARELSPGRSERVERTISAPTWQNGLVVAAFLLLWVQVINHLRAEWTVNPQYGYGWSVPFLALFLFYRRWHVRPAPAPARWKFGTTIVALAAALPFLPARIISIANPDWRLLSWTLAIAVVVISLVGLNLAGGPRWVRYFGFPILFVLIAIPWPAHFEQTIVQGLMRADAAIVVQLLNAVGTIAIQRGNVIELSTGLVGIADACTGIRSLQSTLMISLFLGEYYRMSAPRRVILIAAASLLAFVCNLVRTLVLCLVASASGVDAIRQWHDSAGLTILLVCITGLWLLSLRMSKDVSPPVPAPAAPSGGALSGLWPIAAALLLWIGLTEICAAGWYRAQRANSPQTSSWSVSWPADQKAYAPAKIPEAAQELLLYNEGGGANWTGADGHPWMMYYFRWLPGRTAAHFVKFHRPDVCLPATGMTMTRDNGIRFVTVNGVHLPIRSYRFENGSTPLHISYCYWDARSSYSSESAANEEDWTVRGRLRAAWGGRRETGAQMLEVVVWDYDNDADAVSALQRQLEEIVHPVDGERVN